MIGAIAWLDTSADEQRRVRELIALFAQPGTLDELGLGQIRDVLSNALFPGTSVLLTRARYFVLVPWSFLRVSVPGRTAAEVRAHADLTQRALIVALQGSGQVGVIGSRLGAEVKTLPSTIYWNGLLTFGILRRDVGPDGLSALRSEREGGDELASRVRSDWNPTLPEVPSGFPATVDGGLDLTATEAAWLRERILESVPGTLLAHLVASDQAPGPLQRLPLAGRCVRLGAGVGGGGVAARTSVFAADAGCVAVVRGPGRGGLRAGGIQCRGRAVGEA